MAEIRAKLASGEIQVNSGYIPPPWTEEAKKELDKVLGDIFGWKKEI